MQEPRGQREREVGPDDERGFPLRKVDQMICELLTPSATLEARDLTITDFREPDGTASTVLLARPVDGEHAHRGMEANGATPRCESL